MISFIKIPHWAIAIFSILCLTQARAWFEEITDSFHANRNSFTLRGQHFTLFPNRSFIMDKTLNQYGLDFNYNQTLN